MKPKHLILTLAVVALLFAACDKSSDQQTDEIFDQYPKQINNSTNNFYNKQQGGGLQIDTAWDGDTIIVEF